MYFAKKISQALMSSGASIIFASTLLLAFVACSPKGADAGIFFAKMSLALEQNTENIQLKKVTDFGWDRACIFQNDDSEKYAAYDEYANFLKSTYASANEIKRNAYTNIIMFSYKGNIIQTYGLINPRIEVRGKKLILSAKELYPREDETMFCESQENLFLEISEEDEQIYITKRQGEWE